MMEFIGASNFATSEPELKTASVIVSLLDNFSELLYLFRALRASYNGYYPSFPSS